MLRKKHDEAKLHSEPSSCYATTIENLNNKAITTSVTEQQNKVEHTKLLRTAISVSKGFFLYINAYVPIFQAFFCFVPKKTETTKYQLRNKTAHRPEIKSDRFKNAFVNRLIFRYNF